MARSYAHQYLGWWYQAAEAEIGVSIKTDDRQKLTAVLYEARSEAQDPVLAEIMMMQIGPDELFLIKKSTELEE